MRFARLTVLIVVTVFSSFATAKIEKSTSRRPMGPLAVHPKNPRYFQNTATGEAVYLTGSHTWNSLVDMGRSDPPETFDFAAYLDFLDRHGHNFIRLWAFDSFTWDTRANASREEAGKSVLHVSPLPWARKGPGEALDGQPKFDLTQPDPAYFDRLRARVSAAGKRGIYVSVMLFEGWGLMHGNRRPPAPGWAWRSHPFHPGNNVNGINADRDGDGITGELHRLGDDAVNGIQAAYLRKVVDTVSDLDNVLYEVINEGGQKEWDWWVVKTVREYERTKPKQHPVGITGHGAERLDSMLASPAEWISPGRNDGYGEDPPAWDGKKVSLLDTDHIWGIGGNPAWVWKSFLRGHNPIFMDPYDGDVLGSRFDAKWEPIRKSLGYTLNYARRMNLAEMLPSPDLASTKFCLANPGKEYLIYNPSADNASFTAALKAGKYKYEWFNPSEGKIASTGTIEAKDGSQSFEAPFKGDAVLFLAGDGK